MLEHLKLPDFHKNTIQLLKCGLYMVTGDSSYNNKYVIAWITKISINPLILSLTVDKTQYDIDVLENSKNLTIHIFAESQIDEEKKLLREINIGNISNRENTLTNNSETLKSRCAFLTCNIKEKIDADDLKIYLASVMFSRVDHTKKPLYFQLDHANRTY